MGKGLKHYNKDARKFRAKQTKVDNAFGKLFHSWLELKEYKDKILSEKKE